MVVIFFSVLAALILFLLATSLKGIAAVVEALIDLTDIWTLLLFGGGLVLAIELMMFIVNGGFWNIVITVIILGIFAFIFDFCLPVLLGIFTLVMQVFVFIFGVLYSLIKKIGDLCEKGFMYFLGVINKKISVS